MPREANFLSHQGSQTVGSDFLWEYQRCVLLALREEGILDQEQLEHSLFLLKNQCLTRRNT